ncbi:MAG: FecR domain-containing protein, partial [Planctomycetota bacterium]|nr:FecR domain-containing protein [Planctomycetota bacterium]
MTPDDHSELRELIHVLRDGKIDEAGLQRLEELAGGDPEAMRLFVDYRLLEARLERELASPGQLDDCRPKAVIATGTSEAAPVVVGDRSPSRPKSRALAWSLVLTGLVVIGVAGWYAAGSPHQRLPFVREVTGDVILETPAGSVAVTAGQLIHAGECVRSGDEGSRFTLEYADGTRVTADVQSRVCVPDDSGGVHLRLLSGTMEVHAAPQSPDDPLVFATDHARYVVVGTRFRLYREAGASRLELDEGKVRLERRVDGQSVEVSAGHVAVTTSEKTPLTVNRLAIGQATLSATLRRAGQAVAFSEDGQLLATGHPTRGLKLWKAPFGEPVQSVDGDLGRIDSLVCVPPFVVSVGSDHSSELRILEAGESTARKAKLSSLKARSRALSPDGTFAARSDDDGTHVFAVDPMEARCRKILTLPADGKAWCLAVSRTAKFVAAGYWDGTVRVHELSNGNSAQQVVFEEKLQHTPTRLAMTDDGQWIAVTSSKDGLLLINPHTGERVEV